MTQFLKGDQHPRWKGGKMDDGQGYIKILCPSHPNNNQGYVLEHRLIVEKNIGRLLKANEIVHHKNGVRDDNRLENLQLMTIGEHRVLHQTGRPCPDQTRKKISDSLIGHPKFGSKNA